jgi:hypothetical protein
MKNLPPSPPSSDADRATRTSRRVVRRVEARNELTWSEAPGAFDFVVDDVDPADSSLGILASYLGVAACEQSLSLGLTIDVDRVTAEVERPPTRPDGGTVAGVAGDVPESVEHPVELDGAPSRVRVLIEARTDEPAEALAAWRDRLLDDRLPSSMAPGLVGVDLLVTSAADDGR